MHKHGTNTTLVFLPADGEVSWSLLASLVSLLSGGTLQTEKTYYPQGDGSGLIKLKKDKHKHQSQLPSMFISLSQSQLI